MNTFGKAITAPAIGALSVVTVLGVLSPAAFAANSKKVPPTTTAAIAAKNSSATGGAPVDFEALMLSATPQDFAKQIQQQWGFPTWWPVPAKMDQARDHPLTIQEVSVDDSVDDYKTVVTKRKHSTTYYLNNPDVDAAEKLITGALAGAPFTTPSSDRNSGDKNGKKYVSLEFKSKTQPDNYDTRLRIDIYQAGAKKDEITGVAINIETVTSTIPGRERPKIAVLTAFNGLPPLPSATLQQTTARISGGFFGGFSGSYSVRYKMPVAKETEVETQLSSASGYTGDIKLSGAAKTDKNGWEQPFLWKAKKGTLNIYKSTSTDAQYLSGNIYLG
jgi:hypothetical protein